MSTPEWTVLGGRRRPWTLCRTRLEKNMRCASWMTHKGAPRMNRRWRIQCALTHPNALAKSINRAAVGSRLWSSVWTRMAALCGSLKWALFAQGEKGWRYVGIRLRQPCHPVSGLMYQACLMGRNGPPLVLGRPLVSTPPLVWEWECIHARDAA